MTITMFDVAWALSWTALALSTLLFALKAIHLHNASEDVEIAKNRAPATIAAAHGLLRLARLQMVVGYLWLLLGVSAVMGRYSTAPSIGVRIGGRATMCLLILFEIAKLVADDRTSLDIMWILRSKK